MTANTITLVLNGEVSLADFAVTIERLRQLITALTVEVAGGAEIVWDIEDLGGGGALATIVGLSAQPHAVEQVVHAYEEIGRALEQGAPIRYSAQVQNYARAIPTVLNGRITSILFSTANKDAAILSPSGAERHQGPAITYSWGTVRGQVETLSSRCGLRFTLYDSLFGKAIVCYGGPEHKGQMREIWGRNVVVTGRVGRVEDTGQPRVIRDVRNIEIVQEVAPGSFEAARGLFKGLATEDEKPEDAIRRIRSE